MLKIFFLAGLGIAGAVVAWLVLSYVLFHRRSTRHRLELLNKVEPALAPLLSGGLPDASELERLAADRLTRTTLFDLLLRQHRLDLFPSRFRTQVSLAEADLAVWLSHPNELGCAPDEMDLVDSPQLTSEDGIPRKWLVFKFRTQPPHWAAKDGWLAGVVGPKAVTDVDAMPGAQVVFSRFEPIESRSPTQHVQAVRELLGAKRP